MTSIQKKEHRYIQKLIQQGEHQTMDFKFAVNDSRKIARSLVAFANTDGGTLLVGVKDNGKIAGIQSEEEIFMIDAAATLHCKPAVEYKLRLWEPLENKQVLEVIVKKQNSHLYRAKNEYDQWTIYLRKNDNNIAVENIYEKIWNIKNNKKKHNAVFTEKDNIFIKHFSKKVFTIREVIETTGYNKNLIENMIIDYIQLGIIDLVDFENELVFEFKNL